MGRLGPLTREEVEQVLPPLPKKEMHWEIGRNVAESLTLSLVIEGSFYAPENVLQHVFGVEDELSSAGNLLAEIEAAAEELYTRWNSSVNIMGTYYTHEDIR